jgi:hypothetical protein
MINCLPFTYTGRPVFPVIVQPQLPILETMAKIHN